MRIIAVLALLATMNSPAAAMTYFLRSDQGVQGLERFCEYSNGQTYTVNSIDLCPMSIEDNPVASGTGFLQGEYQDGMTKVCVYDVLGSEKGLRVNAAELCPLTAKF
ncbi:hypothetical protein PRN20_04470 [Devosia sp. ZB163]|jgi:hypothetical protein|uniref:hypothetical protein n=1 Tax=Devosia sp. ZB163 TaxID=3025938 RepID=UPI002361CB2E|nr:hypothetical protein [Devosia sp. ZB163]MDC9822976.1 hypothetical protein [Devosia sp. ZB163]